MFDRFTDDARLSFGLARQAALQHGQGTIDSPHILLGLIHPRCQPYPASQLLIRLGVNLKALASDLAAPAASPAQAQGLVPFTPQAKSALEALGQRVEACDAVGSDLLLLALCHESQALTRPVLAAHGITAEALERELGLHTQGAD